MDVYLYNVVGNFLIWFFVRDVLFGCYFNFLGRGGGDCMVEIGCGEEEFVNFIGGYILEYFNL